MFNLSHMLFFNAFINFCSSLCCTELWILVGIGLIKMTDIMISFYLQEYTEMRKDWLMTQFPLLECSRNFSILIMILYLQNRILNNMLFSSQILQKSSQVSIITPKLSQSVDLLNAIF